MKHKFYIVFYVCCSIISDKKYYEMCNFAVEKLSAKLIKVFQDITE